MKKMTALALLFVLAGIATPITAERGQTTADGGGVLAIENSHEQCWREHMRRMGECRDEFCNWFGCNDSALLACNRSARYLLNKCVAD